LSGGGRLSSKGKERRGKKKNLQRLVRDFGKESESPPNPKKGAFQKRGARGKGLNEGGKKEQGEGFYSPDLYAGGRPGKKNGTKCEARAWKKERGGKSPRLGGEGAICGSGEATWRHLPRKEECLKKPQIKGRVRGKGCAREGA